MPVIKAVLFDMIGTTVLEKDPSCIHRCFRKAFEDHNIAVSDELIRTNRGKDKKEAIKAILAMSDFSFDQVESILLTFKKNVASNLSNFQENEGVREIIHYLWSKNILVGIGSGLSTDIFYQIFHYLNWSSYGFDYIGIAEEIGRGRPHPDMLLDMMKKLNVSASEFLKVGDTVADIEEGRNAKVRTVALLSGTQDEKELSAHHPDYMIRSLMELKEIL